MENPYPRGLKHRTGPISLPSDMLLSLFRWSFGVVLLWYTILYCPDFELHYFRRRKINICMSENSLIKGTSASQQEGFVLASRSCNREPQSQPWRSWRTSPWTSVLRLSLRCSKVPGEVQVQLHGLHLGGAGEARQTACICSGLAILLKRQN